ncbi:DNA-binding transcriptional regulator BolA [Buchnera aphidicola (Cinara splendens)]|uniref:DNA-binding transcriptional regulator BolA n=1 Tax=Buchnera aphidicola (Cinara splendens) TaxID=2518979 RepID=A0A451DEI0_9GAMM|nr:BolA family protein [Buchnera aphidicola]VFP85052.1 DNA-binding transcriptional regulator BolA [Buchnera aphidicola (Cinara splendens)]
MKKIIEKKIKSILNILYLKIDNISKIHKNQNKNLKHFLIVVSAYEFNKLSLYNQHRIIYNILCKYIPQKIYAIQLHTYTTYKWEKTKNPAFLLTPCVYQTKKVD